MFERVSSDRKVINTDRGAALPCNGCT